MIPFTSKYVVANGIRTHYLEEGSGEPVILLHGGGAGADGYSNWHSTIPLLAKHFRVLALDMLGFGKNEKPDETKFTYSQSARNDHLVGFIEALGLTGVTLVGNSMGGATSIGATVKRPDLIRKLVLMGSAGITRHLPDSLKPILQYDYTREGMVRLMRTLCNDDFRINDEMVNYRMAMAAEPDTRRAYTATMGWVRQQGGLFYDLDFIRQVKIPTLIVNGKDDKVVKLSDAIEFLSVIARSWAYFIPECGHWAMLEHPNEFASATYNFIRNAHD